MMYKALVFLPLAGCLLETFFGRFISRGGGLLSSVAMGLAAFLSCLAFFDVTIDGHEQVIPLMAWMKVGDFQAMWALKIDTLTSVMLVVVTVVSFLVHVYSLGYMRDDPHRARFFAYLSFFTFAMLMLVTANDFVQLFFGWEGVGLASYLLIGFWYGRASANEAAIKAFVVNRVGDVGLVAGIAIIFSVTGSVVFEDIFAQSSLLASTFFFEGLSWSALDFACAFLFLGAMGKSAQLFLHVWLPDAMEGPTPVSALIHAATMVTAGVFLVARCSPLYDLSGDMLNVILPVGAVTALFAASVALVQNDIKRIIAYSTCSQLGFMFAAAGVGAYEVAMFHLFTHAFFKALLFLGAGSVIHALHHEQDIQKMGGLYKIMPATWVSMVIGVLSLTGVPLAAGYYSKDAVIETVFMSASPLHEVSFILLLVASVMTAFYSWRLMFLVFHGRTRVSQDTYKSVRESPLTMVIPLAFLGFGALATGALFAPLFIGELHSFFWRGSIDSAPSVLAALATVPFLVKVSPVLAMALGLGVAWYVIVHKAGMADTLAHSFPRLYRFLLNKWYWDELYEKIFIAPAQRLARFLWHTGDGGIIDGFGPDGVAKNVTRASRVAARLQTGYVYHYAFAMVIGITAIFSYVLIVVVSP